MTNTNATGSGSLLDAITQANGIGNPDADTITITATGIIRLGSSLPALQQDLIITGPGATNLVVSGRQTSSILRVEANVHALVSGLTFADGVGPFGGGAVTNAGTLILRGCILTNNIATNGGGAILNQGSLVLDGCTLISNRVVGLEGVSVSKTNEMGGSGVNGEGGALYCLNGNVRLTNCTFSGNSAVGGKGGDNEEQGGGGTGGGGFGGAICFENGSLVVVNCTITKNYAQGGAGGTVEGDLGPPGSTGYGIGGGFFCFSNISANVSFLNTIIAGNSVSVGDPSVRSDVRGYFNSLGGNLVQVTNGLTTSLRSNDIVNTSPLLGPLQNNLGPVPTQALLTNSPALDAGVATGAPVLDARGVIRPQGAGVDIGAYEWGNQSIAFPAISNRTYGVAPFELMVPSSSGLPVILTIISGPAYFSPTNNRLLIITGAGTVTVVASQGGNGLYLPAPDITNSFDVGRASLVVSAPTNASRPYGQINPVFVGTITGLVSGDSITPNFLSTAPLTAPAATYASDTDYALTPQLLDPSSRLANYIVTTNQGAFTVTKAVTSLAFRADDARRAYGMPNPSFSYSLTGTPMPWDQSSITADCQTIAANTSPVGQYSIVPVPAPASVLSNYNWSVTNGTLTVTQAILTVQAGDTSRPYGAANPPLVNCSLTGTKPWDSTNILAAYDTSATNTSPMGVYAIYPRPDSNSFLSNYLWTPLPGTLTITQATGTLVVQAKDAVRAYGETNPLFACHLEGVMPWDSNSIPVRYTTTATNTSPVGAYAIVPQPDLTSVLTNYNWSTTNGTLTVTQALLTVTVRAGDTEAVSKLIFRPPKVSTTLIKTRHNSNAEGDFTKTPVLETFETISHQPPLRRSQSCARPLFLGGNSALGQHQPPGCL